MKIKILFLSVVVSALLIVCFFYLKKNKINSSPSESTLHELWEIRLLGDRPHSSCKGFHRITIFAPILFPEGLSDILKSPATDQPKTSSGKGAWKVVEQSVELESSDIQNPSIDLQTQWSLVDKKPQLQVNIWSQLPLAQGLCIKNKNSVPDPLQKITLKSETFNNNAIQGKWDFGTFEMKWISGGSSGYKIAGPMETKAIAASNNVTVSWNFFPGADFYKVYVVNGATMTNKNVLRALETKENFAIITDLTSGAVYGFVVSAIVNGHEFENPQAVIAKPAMPITAAQVTTGNNHACALLFDKKVLCWGANNIGQVGDGSKTTFSLPVLVPNVENVSAIKAEGDRTCASFQSGPEKCWGNEVANTSKRAQSTPLENTSLTASGLDFICNQLTDATLRCLGSNDKGQLASGNQIPQTIAQEPSALKTEKLKANSISAGEQFACAITQAQNVICWGANHLGQIGNGSGSFSAIPQMVRF